MSKKSNKELYFAIRDLGYRPRIKHFRFVNEAFIDYSVVEPGTKELELGFIREMKLQDSILAKGGATTVMLISDEPDVRPNILQGLPIATCSTKDNYNKKIGVHIALARALEFLEMKPE